MTEIQNYLIKTIQEMDNQNQKTLQEQEVKIRDLQNNLKELQNSLETWNQHFQNLTELVNKLSSSYSSLQDYCQNQKK